MGKTAGSDLRKHKATHPAVFGLDASRAEAARLLEEVRHAVTALGEPGAVLVALAEFGRATAIVTRREEPTTTRTAKATGSGTGRRNRRPGVLQSSSATVSAK